MGQKLKVMQSVFNKGELSPRLIGRVDNASYYKAYDEGLNMIPFPEGAATFRPGTVFVKEVKDSTKVTIIRPFRFSSIQNYILEFGDQYVRFYRNRGRVETAPDVAYEVATPYLEADLRELYLFQSADVLYILHPDYAPRTLVRTSDTNWSLNTISFVDGPYLQINSSTTTLTASAVTGAITLTASAPTFVATDVGRQMRIRVGSGTWTWGTITAFTSTTVVDFTISGPNLSATTATTSWRFGVFGGDRGWPAVGTIYEERLILARTIDLPSTLWGSQTGDLTNYGPSNLADGVIADDNGFSFTIADDQVNNINWISSGRTLLIGTNGGEHSMSGGTNAGYAPITPTNITIKRESNYGSKPNLPARRVGNAVLYPSQSARKVREMYYEFGIDSYISKDTTLFSEHVLRSGIVDISYTQEPDPHYWTCTNNGELIGMVYERTQEIEGWHRHTLGGVNTVVESIASIPRPDDENDDLWLLVSRTVDGATVRYIEYMSELYEDVIAPITGAPNRSYAKYLDSCITYDGYLDSTITAAATTGSVIVFTAGSSVFSAGDVGKQIRIGTGRATIVTYNSGTSVDADITTAIPSTNAYAAGQWSLAAKVFTGADHLEGQTVGVVADGYITDDEVISSGSLTIDSFASVVHIGLRYAANIKLLPVEVPSQGTIQGRERSTALVHIHLTNTYGLKLNTSDTDITDTIKFLKFPLVTDQAPDFVNGLISVHPPSGYDRNSQLELIHDVPLPFTLNYIVQDLDVNA